ncbi:MAG: gamma-glutamyl phosphate reductase [Alphaproteobacteria bacterium]|nr:gamma-glutamyl phosphate reductase [Alphaproteobacteria bacterium]
MTIQVIAPRGTETDAAALIAQQEQARRDHPLQPFAEETKNFLAAFSELLLHDTGARKYPELQALGFWLRPASLQRVEAHFKMTQPAGSRSAPRGLVLHFPPANVDTIFVYTLALALLAGNASITRLSGRAGAAGQLLAALLRQACAQAGPAIAAHIYIVRYAHDAATTGLLSRAADVRMIWGGDEAVAAVRAIAAGPLTKDLAFADKFSWAAFDAKQYAAMPEDAREKMAGQFANDLFWYEQMACSSPRAIAWVGTEDAATGAGDDFYRRVSAAAGYKAMRIDAGAHMARLGADYLAQVDLPITLRRTFGPRLAVLRIIAPEALLPFKRVGYGHGLLIECVLPGLAALADMAERRDQTLVHAGFSPAILQEFAARCGGRGFDRLVPPGQALAFHHIWDGYDIVRELTRCVQTGFEAGVS